MIDKLISKMTGWQIMVLLIVGVGTLAYGWSEGKLDAQALGVAMTILGALGYQVGPKGPGGPPPPALEVTP